jgi:hypothetical protein
MAGTGKQRVPKPDRYGLMPGERELLEENQSYMCAVCGRLPSTRRLSVDHHHACGKYDPRGSVRGLLCHRCNRGLLGENPTLLRQAAEYFEAHVCSPKPVGRRRAHANA